MNNDLTKPRVAGAALAGAIQGIRNEFPMHNVETITEGSLMAQVRISHPTAMNLPRYFVIKISEPM
jgi:hypothetical protein